MKSMKKIIKGITSTLLIGGIFFSSFSYSSAEDFNNEELILTPEQQLEVDDAKQRTEQAIKDWDENVKTETLESEGFAVLGVGGAGDILVTLDSASSGSSAWAGGHAGIVYDTTTVVESFGNKGSLNGVRKWDNDWNTRYTHFQQERVSGATSTNYTAAKSYAATKVGLPYNYNFFDISTTSAFYCSQLVWRAWMHQNFDLNDGGAVWPVDLIQSPLTYTVYIQ
jgi:uncharacterized protein YycO